MEKLGPADPQQIGAYRLLARLGAGGMGQVYLARSARGRTVAVKLVRQELAEQEEFRSRFRQEVAAARRVGGRWTAPVLDADTEAVVPWVATGYVAGPDLHTVVSGDGPLPERSVHILATGLALALRDIHSAALIHRDLKPSNILVTIDGPRVIDFGIARALETVTGAAALTRTGSLVGSPGFMAPEQIRGERITAPCDIFCLGSVLAYAATGRLPFGTADSGVHALMYRIATEPPTLDGIPEGLQDLIRSCLRKDPEARPSLDEVLENTRGGDTGDPWLPAALVAQLGRHAVELLDTEDPATSPAAPGIASTLPAPHHRTTPDAAQRSTVPGGDVQGRSPQGVEHNHRERINAVPERSTPEETPRRGTDPEATDPNAPGKRTGPEATAPSAPAPAPAPHATPTIVTPGHARPRPPQPPAALPPLPPGYGYPPPTPQYLYQPPAPEPPPRTARSTAALIAVALVVALGAGGSVYAFMNAGDEKQHTDSRNEDPPPPTVDTSQQQKTTPPPTKNATIPAIPAIPAQYLGTWTAGLDSAAGHSTRRLVIQQGQAGDTVLSLTAEGPTEGGGTYHCVFQAELSAAPTDNGPLRIGPSRVTVGEPMTSCSPGAATEVTLLPDGRLRRVNPANGESLTYAKTN